jgi:hypothetical protein
LASDRIVPAEWTVVGAAVDVEMIDGQLRKHHAVDLPLQAGERGPVRRGESPVQKFDLAGVDLETTQADQGALSLTVDFHRTSLRCST